MLDFKYSIDMKLVNWDLVIVSLGAVCSHGIPLFKKEYLDRVFSRWAALLVVVMEKVRQTNQPETGSTPYLTYHTDKVSAGSLIG